MGPISGELLAYTDTKLFLILQAKTKNGKVVKWSKSMGLNRNIWLGSVRLKLYSEKQRKHWNNLSLITHLRCLRSHKVHFNFEVLKIFVTFARNQSHSEYFLRKRNNAILWKNNLDYLYGLISYFFSLFKPNLWISKHFTVTLRLLKKSGGSV